MATAKKSSELREDVIALQKWSMTIILKHIEEAIANGSLKGKVAKVVYSAPIRVLLDKRIDAKK